MPNYFSCFPALLALSRLGKFGNARIQTLGFIFRKIAERQEQEEEATVVSAGVSRKVGNMEVANVQQGVVASGVSRQEESESSEQTTLSEVSEQRPTVRACDALKL